MGLLVGAALVACADEGGGPGSEQAPTVGSTPTATAMARSSPTAAPATVPAEFRPLYHELEGSLLAAREAFAARAQVGEQPSLLLDLLVANGNRGEELLAAGTLDAARLFLDRFEELGAAGVAIQIVYPLLDEGYPRSDEYLAFYRSVVDEARKRGLKVVIATGAPFSGTEFSTLHIDYAGKTPRSYLAERLAQAGVVAHELRPDYLCLSEEQDTERMLTGLEITTDDYLEFLRAAPAEIDPPPGVKLGAGSGSWESAELVRRLIEDSELDFVDIHIYPLSSGYTDYLEVSADWASAARAAGKEVIIGEAWLYKASAQELRTGMSFQQLFARDVFSFWQPPDILFMQTVVELARATGVGYVSFFWSRYLFGYVDYDTAPPDATGPALQRAANEAAATAVMRGEVSAVGEEFRRLAAASDGGG